MVDSLNWHFCQWKMCPNIALVNERFCVDHMERIAKISERNRKRAPLHSKSGSWSTRSRSCAITATRPPCEKSPPACIFPAPASLSITSTGW